MIKVPKKYYSDSLYADDLKTNAVQKRFNPQFYSGTLEGNGHSPLIPLIYGQLSHE